MSDWHVKPWVGDNYESGGVFRKRVLILGESFYQRKENALVNPQYCIHNIQEQISGEQTYKFWTNIAIAFLNKRPLLEEKVTFWHSVAYCNFVQELVGSGPRQRPHEDMWSNGSESFWALLRELRPQCMIVLGYDLWEHLPEEGTEFGPCIANAGRPQTWRYPVSGTQQTLAYAIRHPSGGFSGWHEHQSIKKVMDLS